MYTFLHYGGLLSVQMHCKIECREVHYFVSPLPSEYVADAVDTHRHTRKEIDNLCVIKLKLKLIVL